MMEPFCFWIRQKFNCDAHIFYDDLLVTALDYNVLKELGEKLIQVFQELGFDIHPDKCTLTPCKDIDFLGAGVRAHPTLPEKCSVYTLEKKRKKVVELAEDFFATPTVGNLLSFLGTASFNSLIAKGGRPEVTKLARSLAWDFTTDRRKHE
jgi:hypothetical protein